MADRYPALAGMILVAPPGEPLIVVFIGQAREIGALQGAARKQIEA